MQSDILTTFCIHINCILSVIIILQRTIYFELLLKGVIILIIHHNYLSTNSNFCLQKVVLFRQIFPLQTENWNIITYAPLPFVDNNSIDNIIFLSCRSVCDRPAAVSGWELPAEFRGDLQHPQTDGRRCRRHSGHDRDGRGETDALLLLLTR